MTALTDEQLAKLAAIPAKWAQPPKEMIAKLPKPYKKESPKGNCSECGGWHGLPAVHLDYLGHAETTLALCEIDPGWEWHPAGIDPATDGPRIVRDGNRSVMWGFLTVHGKTLPGVGIVVGAKEEIEKELIGDFLRNAAQRFGIASSLWSKADHAVAETETAPEPEIPFASEPEVDAFLHRIDAFPEKARLTLKEEWAEAGLPKLAHIRTTHVAQVDKLITDVEGIVAAGVYDEQPAPDTEG